jgi:hypothetical protein
MLWAVCEKFSPAIHIAPGVFLLAAWAFQKNILTLQQRIQLR